MYPDRNHYSNDPYVKGQIGKSVLVSFPAHEVHLIKEWERLAQLDMTTKSQYFRRCIRRESRMVDEHIGRRYAP